MSAALPFCLAELLPLWQAPQAGGNFGADWGLGRATAALLGPSLVTLQDGLDPKARPFF